MRWRTCAVLSATLFFGRVSEVGATEPPSPCAGVNFVAAPAPIEAGRPAIRLFPNRGANGRFSVRLIAESGPVTALAAEDQHNGTFLLRPEARLTAGAYLLEYSDSCADGPTTRPVVFQSAPQPRPEDFQLFRAVKTHICLPRIGIQPLPYQTLELPFPPELVPYFPFLRIAVNGTEHSFAPFRDPPPLGDRLAVFFDQACGLGTVTGAATGTSEFTLTLGIIDGSELVHQTAWVAYDCTLCPDTVPDAGLDASPTDDDTGSNPAAVRGCQCAFGRRASHTLLSPLGVLAGVATWARRRVRACRRLKAT